MASQTNVELISKTPVSIPNGSTICIIKTAWNAAIVDALEIGCHQILKQHGVASITIQVPGAIEIPFAIKAYAAAKPVAAFIALGCVIKGDTPHFEYVCQSVTQGITLLNVQLQVPVIFGILTVNTQEQALQRIGGIHGHKGEEAALTALAMIGLNHQLQSGSI